jgi:membrane protein DedA with SNARE-associated domain
MVEFAEQLRVWTEEIVALLGYPGITVMMLFENIFPPIPAEVVMPFSGFLVVRGEFNMLAVIIAGTIGSVLGALVLYGFGRWARERVVRKVVRRYGRFLQVSEADLDRSLATFNRYGDAVVLFGRVIPLFRTFVSIPAGICKMPLPRFIVFTVLGSSLWNAGLTYIGVALGENWGEMLMFLDRYKVVTNVVVALVAVLLVARFVANYFRVAEEGRRTTDDRRPPTANDRHAG